MPLLEFICLLGLLWVEFITDTDKLQESYLRRYNFDIFAQSTFRQVFGFRRKCHLMFCAQLWRSHHWESLSARRRMVLHHRRNNHNQHHHQNYRIIIIVIIVFVFYLKLEDNITGIQTQRSTEWVYRLGHIPLHWCAGALCSHVALLIP